MTRDQNHPSLDSDVGSVPLDHPQPPKSTDRPMFASYRNMSEYHKSPLLNKKWATGSKTTPSTSLIGPSRLAVGSELGQILATSDVSSAGLAGVTNTDNGRNPRLLRREIQTHPFDQELSERGELIESLKQFGSDSEDTGSSANSLTLKRTKQPMSLRINTFGAAAAGNSLSSPTGGTPETRNSMDTGEYMPRYSQSAGLPRAPNIFQTPTKRSAQETDNTARGWTPASARAMRQPWANDGQSSASPLVLAVGGESSKDRRPAKIWKENWRAPATPSGQNSAANSGSNSAQVSPACIQVLNEVFAGVGRKGLKNASHRVKNPADDDPVKNTLGEPGPVLEDFESSSDSIGDGEGERLRSHDHRRRLSTIQEPDPETPPSMGLTVRSLEDSLGTMAVSKALIPFSSFGPQMLNADGQRYSRAELSSNLPKLSRKAQPNHIAPERMTSRAYHPKTFGQSNDDETQVQRYTRHNSRRSGPMFDPFASHGLPIFPPGTHPVPRLIRQPQMHNQYFPGWHRQPQQQGFAYQGGVVQPNPFGFQQQQWAPTPSYMQPAYQQAGWQQAPLPQYIDQALPIAGTDNMNPVAFIPSPGGPLFERTFGTPYDIGPSPENIVNVRSRAAPPIFPATLPNVDWDIRSSNSGMIGRHLNANALTTLPYQPDTDIMCPVPMVAGASVKLQQLIRNGKPSIHHVMNPENLPFIELAKEARPARWGVIKITNIPYICKRSDVINFLGRSAKILKRDVGSPVHLIMERNSGKTMDCFVEFYSHGDALAAVNKINRLKEIPTAKTPKLGDRHVDATLSSQEELMRVLFPRASKAVTWYGQEPTVTDLHSGAFKGFLDREDMIMMTKYASDPGRFGFCIKMPTRTYECMISTLYKFPWFATRLYTVAQRNWIFDTLYQQTSHLVRHLKTGYLSEHLSEELLEDLLYAGLNVPAFSEHQRFRLTHLARPVGQNVACSPLMERWPFEVLNRKKHWEEDVVKYYISIIVTAANQRPTNDYDPYKLEFKMSLEEAGSVEMAKLKSLLEAALQDVNIGASRDLHGTSHSP